MTSYYFAPIVVTRHLSRDGGMAEDLEAWDADNYSRREQDTVHRKRVTIQLGAQRVRNLTVQNETTIVLSQMTAGACMKDY